MTYVHLNFSNGLYAQSQTINSKSALDIGGLDKSYSKTPKDLPYHFYWKHRQLFKYTRGFGYWIWKPYLIREALRKMVYGDFLFYTDSGCYFIKNVESLFNQFEANTHIMAFELPYKESSYTKRDTFVYMNCDTDAFTQSKQRLSTYILFKKTDITLSFVDEWLTYTSDKRIVTDQDNTCGMSNYSDFIAHRHDQSVFSLLSKKYGFEGFRDPSQYGNSYIADYPNSSYEQLLCSNRQKNIDYSPSIAMRIFRKVLNVL